MDWSKAKTILIVALLITNLFLIFTYVAGKEKPTSNANDQTLVDFLEKKNIFLNDDLDIPQNKSMPVLHVQYEPRGEELVNKLLDSQKPLARESRTDEDYRKAAEAFIQNAELTKRTAVFNGVERVAGEVIVTYINEKDNKKIEKSHIICTFRDGKIVAFDYYWLNPLEYHSKKQNTTSASSALLTFMSQNTETEAVHIEHIEMIYWLDESKFDAESAIFDTASPTWKIKYNEGKIKYIAAYEQ